MKTLTPPRPTRFLVVEDDDDHAEIVIRTLKRHASQKTIDRAIDGVQALSYLHREGAFEGNALPDVILLDLKLPKKDGHEVLADIKGDEELRLIPVVILTTSDAEVDRLRAYRLSANSYLVKPLDGDQFDKMIRDLCLYWATWNRGPSGDQ
jgi:CheY-like chemotaxis protein